MVLSVFPLSTLLHLLNLKGKIKNDDYFVQDWKVHINDVTDIEF